MQLEDAFRYLEWSEIQLMGAVAAEAEARGLHDLGQSPTLAALVEPSLERARQRQATGRTPSQVAPAEAGFRTEREFHEHAMRAALWVGERQARRFWPSFGNLSDAEMERLWRHAAAVIETSGLSKTERIDAEALACKVMLGVHQATWPLVAAIVDANRVHENGGVAPDYDGLLAPLLIAPLPA